MTHPVYLNDTDLTYKQALERFADANRWAQEMCASYRGHDVRDVSDVSVYYDLVAVYVFVNEADSVLFSLRWR
jgi:hypothetical protein